MVKAKKMLAVVLSVVMLLTCFVVSTSALTYAPANTTGEIKVIATADKTTVNPGDVVTVSLALDPGSKSDFGAFGNVVTYNANQLTPCDVNGNATTTNTAWRTWQNSCADWTNPAASVNFNYAISLLTANFTEEEKAYYTKNAMINGQVYTNAGAVNQAGQGWNPAAGEVYVTFQMKVADTVNPGDEIWVGLHQSSFLKGSSYFIPAGGTRYTNDTYDLTNSMVKLTVASAETSILQWSKAQIRFKGIAEGSTKADYKNTFDVRTVAKISQDDFIAKFGSDDAAKDAILDLGFVYMINGAEFDYDTAVEVANGGTADGYVKKSVTYIQHAADGADYVFTCLVAENPDSAQNDVLTCIAFVKTADETIVFDGPNVVDYSLLYALMPE